MKTLKTNMNDSLASAKSSAKLPFKALDQSERNLYIRYIHAFLEVSSLDDLLLSLIDGIIDIKGEKKYDPAIFIVGGFLRDLLLGLDVDFVNSDIDIYVSDISEEDLEKTLNNIDVHVEITKNRFGGFRFTHRVSKFSVDIWCEDTINSSLSDTLNRVNTNMEGIAYKYNELIDGCYFVFNEENMNSSNYVFNLRSGNVWLNPNHRHESLDALKKAVTEKIEKMSRKTSNQSLRKKILKFNKWSDL